MNSVIQCLFHITEIHNVLQDERLSTIQPAEYEKIILYDCWCSVRELYRALYNLCDGDEIELWFQAFRGFINRKKVEGNVRFERMKQYDAHEFLLLLLQWLQEDLNDILTNYSTRKETPLTKAVIDGAKASLSFLEQFNLTIKEEITCGQGGMLAT